jgi:hypothetical protein
MSMMPWGSSLHPRHDGGREQTKHVLVCVESAVEVATGAVGWRAVLTVPAEAWGDIRGSRGSVVARCLLR